MFPLWYSWPSAFQSEAPPVNCLELLSSHAPLVFVRTGLRPRLFVIKCLSVSVYLSGASLGSDGTHCHSMLLVSLLGLAFGQLFFYHMLACVCVPVCGISCYLIDLQGFSLAGIQAHLANSGSLQNLVIFFLVSFMQSLKAGLEAQA